MIALLALALVLAIPSLLSLASASWPCQRLLKLDRSSEEKGLATVEFKCENCGDVLGIAQKDAALRYAVCNSCGTLHNLEWLKCRADGVAYVQSPVDLPWGTRIGKTDEGLLLEFRPRGQTDGETILMLVVAIVVLSFTVIAVLVAPIYVWMFPVALSTLVIWAMVRASIRDRRQRLECFVNKSGLSIIEKTGVFGERIVEFKWSEIKLIRPFVSLRDNPYNLGPAGSTLRSETHGIEIIPRTKPLIQISDHITTKEHSLFISYHLQRYHRNSVKEGKETASPPHIKTFKKSILMQPTLADIQNRVFENGSEDNEVSCQNCGAPISRFGISARNGLSICSYCNSIEKLEDVAEVDEGRADLLFTPPYDYSYSNSGISISLSGQTFRAIRKRTRADNLWIYIPTATFMAFGLLLATYSLISVLYSLVTTGLRTGDLLHLPLGGCGAIMTIAGIRALTTIKPGAIDIYYKKSESFRFDDAGIKYSTAIGGKRTHRRIARESVRKVYTLADRRDHTSSSRVVIVLKSGQRLTMFPLQSPWHAYRLTEEINKKLRLTAITSETQ